MRSAAPDGGWEVVPVFLGTFTPRLDDKGRLALPAKFRGEVEGGLVICKGQDHCLFAFATDEFVRFTKAIATAPITDRRVREYGRTLFASAHDDRPDAQGRITIPVQLRRYAGLTKDCVVIGANNRMEVWDAVAWQAYADQADQAFADIAEEVLPGVF